MDFAFEEQTSSHAYDVWRMYGAEPLADAPDDSHADGIRQPVLVPPSAAPVADPAPKTPFVRALLAVATAPIPSVALASLLLSLLRRPRRAAILAASRPIFG